MVAPNKSRLIIGLDIGSKRIGVARADSITRLPVALPTIEVKSDILSEVMELINIIQPQAIVLGLPRGLSGQDTPQTTMVQDLQSKLSLKLSVPIYTQDEAVTSIQAEEQLRHSGQPYNKGDIDALAARIILGDFLSSNEAEKILYEKT